MVIAIQNATGIDLHLAISASDGRMLFRFTLKAPTLTEHEHTERLRAGEAHGIVNCPENLRIKLDVSGTGMAIRVVKRREVIDHIDEDGQIDGEETYLEFTLRLMN